MQWFSWLVVSFVIASASDQCQVSKSVLDHYLTGHVISSAITASIGKCVVKCSNEPRCKSINFRFYDLLCELNDAHRLTQPQDYGPREGHAYFHDISQFSTCADIKEMNPEAKSGHYRLTIRDDETIQVYCDMENFGGGWSLVVNISFMSDDHLQREANNCLNSRLCVPNPDDVDESAAGRKMKDEDIHQLASREGTFRVDVFDSPSSFFSVFYRIPSGASNFDSSCKSDSCPRSIISYSYPYEWESNCKGTDHGYSIYQGNRHAVFDGHSSTECGDIWFSSLFDTKRALYGYYGFNGIYPNRNGLLFVK